MTDFPRGVKATMRTRRSWEHSARLTKPLETSRSTATLIDPGVRLTFGPIVFTGKGPLFRRYSSIRKSVSSSPVSSSPAYRYFAAAWNAFIHTSQQCTGSAEFFFITTILMLLCNQWLQQCIYINRLDINKTSKEEYMATNSVAISSSTDTRSISQGAVVVLGRFFFALIFLIAAPNHYQANHCLFGFSRR